MSVNRLLERIIDGRMTLDKHSIQSLELHSHPLLADVGFCEGQVDISSSSVSPKEINECYPLSHGEPVSLQTKDSSDSSGSTDW
jgi:hypothetical protein